MFVNGSIHVVKLPTNECLRGSLYFNWLYLILLHEMQQLPVPEGDKVNLMKLSYIYIQIYLFIIVYFNGNYLITPSQVIS